MHVDEGDCILCTKWKATGVHFLLSGKANVQTATRRQMRVAAGNFLGTMEWGDGRNWTCNAVAAQDGTVVGVLPLAALNGLGDVACGDGFVENLTIVMLRLAFSHAMHDLTQRVSERVVLIDRFNLLPQEGALQAHPHVFSLLLGGAEVTDESRRFVDAMQAARMQPGDVVMQSGDHVRAVMVLVEGVVQTKLSDVVQETLQPGTIVAVEHLVAHTSCTTDFVVADGGPAIVLMMSWDQLFGEFLSQPSAFGYRIMHSLTSLAAEHMLGLHKHATVGPRKKATSAKKGIESVLRAKSVFKAKATKGKEATPAASTRLSDAMHIKSDVPLDARVKMLMHVQRVSAVWRMLSRDQLKPIAEVFPVFAVARGERIVKRGEKASFFGLVLAGEV
jgi:CRP-like cAMP-binding protein